MTEFIDEGSKDYIPRVEEHWKLNYGIAADNVTRYIESVGTSLAQAISVSLSSLHTHTLDMMKEIEQLRVLETHTRQKADIGVIYDALAALTNFRLVLKLRQEQQIREMAEQQVAAMAKKATEQQEVETTNNEEGTTHNG